MGDNDRGVNYLYEPEGTELHWGGLEAAKKPKPQMASLTSSGGGSATHPDDRAGMMGTSVAQAVPKAAPVQHAAPQMPRQQSPEELMAFAHQMLDAQAAQTQGGSSISPRQETGQMVTDTNGQKLPDWLVREQEGR